MGTVVIQGTLPIRPDKRDEAAAAAAEMRAATIVEEGCVAYRFGWAIDDPDVMMVAEEWASEEALAAHAASDHMKVFGQAVGGVLAGAPTVTRYVVASSGPLSG